MIATRVVQGARQSRRAIPNPVRNREYGSPGITREGTAAKTVPAITVPATSTPASGRPRYQGPEIPRRALRETIHPAEEIIPIE
jgi:hypothetical protein